MSNEIRDRLSDNLQSVRSRIDRVCLRVGRESNDVKLVAVTKYAEPEWVGGLISLGMRDLGEARPQQLVLRANQFSKDVRWHLIGHLQRNKADDVLPFAELIHSVDSVRLFEHLAKVGKGADRTPRILLEVNVSGEASKDGFDPQELLTAWPRLQECGSLDVVGLMTMAPLSDDSEMARPVFRRLREFRDRLHGESDGRWKLSELSMGMSGDFEIAIEEGATIVRIGSSLFDGLTNE